MVAEAEIVFQQSLPVVLDIDGDPAAVKSPVKTSPVGVKKEEDCNSSVPVYVPTIRSGSYADIGPKKHMEDEHICIDDLYSKVGCLLELPKPSAFYAVFDGHGGSEAATYVRKNAIKIFFEDEKFPQSSEVDSVYVEDVKSSFRHSFCQADLELAEDCSISPYCGTTALTALISGRLLLVANVGDCKAVLCRKGKAIELSEDHRPSNLLERRRVEECGGVIEDGYLNGELSVTRALGDWDMKFPVGSNSPLISDPEFKHITLNEEDEFLVIGCDGIWDVLKSQEAVDIVKRGLNRHHDPARCSRELAMEALRRETFDNLTVIVVCFMAVEPRVDEPVVRLEKKRCFSLTPEALCSLRNFLDG